MASQPYFRTRALSESAQHARVLLDRYPNLTERELATMIRTFAGLPLLDFGLMVADEQLSDKLDAFYRDHGDKLRPAMSDVLWALAVPALIVVLAFAYLAVA